MRVGQIPMYPPGCLWRPRRNNIPRKLPTVAQLTAGKSSTNQATYTSLSISPAANKPLVAIVVAREGATPAGVVAAGNGLTWVQIPGSSIVTSVYTMTAFRAAGAAPSAGTVAFTFASSPVPTAALWWIGQFTDADETGVNGAGAVRQATTTPNGSTSTGYSNSLAALEHANNLHLAGVMFTLSGASVTPDADFAELYDDGTAENVGLEVQWARGQQTVSPTWLSSGRSGISSIEIKAAIDQ